MIATLKGGRYDGLETEIKTGSDTSWCLPLTLDDKYYLIWPTDKITDKNIQWLIKNYKTRPYHFCFVRKDGKAVYQEI